MITALEIGAGLVLTATLLTLLTLVAAFQLGRLVTRDDAQRQVEARTRRASGTADRRAR